MRTCLSISLLLAAAVWAQDPAPTCAILSPASGSTMGGIVEFRCDALDNAPTVTIRWEFSTGAPFQLMTPAFGTQLLNPAVHAPGPDLMFRWCSPPDLFGYVGPATVRVTVNDSLNPLAICEMPVMVDNNLPPVCSITGPASGSTVPGHVAFVFTAQDSPGTQLTMTFSYDSGAGDQPMTAAAGSPLTNPAVIAPGANRRFLWDAAADMPASITPVTARFTVSDGGPPVVCSITLTVDTNQLCFDCGDCDSSGGGAATVLDALHAAQTAVGIVSPTQPACCDVDSTGAITIIDALRMAQEAAGLPAVLNCQ